MDFSQKLDLWKDQIVTLRNHINDTLRTCEEITLPDKEKDIEKILTTLTEKRNARMELFGTFINHIIEFAPMTGNALKTELDRARTLRMEFNELMERRGNALWWIKNKKNVENKNNELNEKLGSLEALLLSLVNTIDEMLIQIDQTYKECSK